MKLTPPQTLEQLCRLIGAKYAGSPGHLVTGLNEIHRVEEGDLVFVDNQKYYDKALQSKATTVIINKEVNCPAGKALIFSDDPFAAYNMLVSHFHAASLSLKQISDTAKIGNNSVIMPGVYLGNNVTIGEDCIIHPNVTIYDHVSIGNRVIIHSGCVIGRDAFYFKRRPERYERLNSCGSVLIEDDVEVGACCTIDRGVSSRTQIGAGTKIDNHVQVGHDTQIGKMCLFASHVGISGCVIIEDGVTLWGQVGVPSNLIIGKGAVLLGQSGATKSLEGGKTYFGSPAGEAQEKLRELATLRKITRQQQERS